MIGAGSDASTEGLFCDSHNDESYTQKEETNLKSFLLPISLRD